MASRAAPGTPPASRCEPPGGSPTQRRGWAAESLAAHHLEAAGLVLLGRNVHCRRGEIDLLARQGDVLVVAEVRQRASGQYGGAAASITAAKRRRIIAATRFLLAREPGLARLRVRFDAMLVDGEGRIEWIKGAFNAA